MKKKTRGNETRQAKSTRLEETWGVTKELAQSLLLQLDRRDNAEKFTAAFYIITICSQNQLHISLYETLLM